VATHGACLVASNRVHGAIHSLFALARLRLARVRIFERPCRLQKLPLPCSALLVRALLVRTLLVRTLLVRTLLVRTLLVRTLLVSVIRVGFSRRFRNMRYK
jgi:hypothetical protein